MLTTWRRQLSRDGRGKEHQQSVAAVNDDFASVTTAAAFYSAKPNAALRALPAARSRGRIEIDIAAAKSGIESGVDQATLAMVLGDK